MGSKIYTETTNLSQDQRTAVGGDVGTLVSPGGALAFGGGGAVNAAPGSTVTQHIEAIGLQGDSVRNILDGFMADRKSERAEFSGLADSLSDTLAAQGKEIGAALAATRAPEFAILPILIPVLIVVAILAFWS